VKVKGQGHWERNVKIVFHTYLCQKWINLLHQTKTKV